MPKSGARRPFGLLRAASEGLTLALLIAVYAGWLVLIFSGPCLLLPRRKKSPHGENSLGHRLRGDQKE